MPRKVTFLGNTITLNDAEPALKVGDRVRYTVHDWHEGDHTLSGELVSLNGKGGARVRVGSGLVSDIIHDVPTLALTIVAPVLPIKGGA